MLHGEQWTMAEAGEETYRDRIRDRLLVVADALVAREGLMALQARRVSQEADCSIGTLYNIFGDIHGLILEANGRTLADLGSLLTAAAQRTAGGDLETRLMTLAVTYLDFATVHQKRWRAIFEHRLPEGRLLPEKHREDRRRLLSLIDTQLEGAMADVSLREDAAYALFSATHGIVLLSLDGKIGPFDPAQCERRIRFLVHNVISGIAAA